MIQKTKFAFARFKLFAVGQAEVILLAHAKHLRIRHALLVIEAGFDGEFRRPGVAIICRAHALEQAGENAEKPKLAIGRAHETDGTLAIGAGEIAKRFGKTGIDAPRSAAVAQAIKLRRVVCRENDVKLVRRRIEHDVRAGAAAGVSSRGIERPYIVFAIVLPEIPLFLFFGIRQGPPLAIVKKYFALVGFAVTLFRVVRNQPAGYARRVLGQSRVARAEKRQHDERQDQTTAVLKRRVQP